MKMYKTGPWIVKIARSDIERVKCYREEFEEELKKSNPDYATICGGFHGTLDCAIRSMEWLLEELKEVDENEHVYDDGEVRRYECF